MDSLDKLLIISILLVVIGLVIAAIDIQRHAYQKGVRDGWHRGRALSRQEFWQE